MKKGPALSPIELDEELSDIINLQRQLRARVIALQHGNPKGGEPEGGRKFF